MRWDKIFSAYKIIENRKTYFDFLNNYILIKVIILYFHRQINEYLLSKIQATSIIYRQIIIIYKVRATNRQINFNLTIIHNI